jgi:hypothetical protein
LGTPFVNGDIEESLNGSDKGEGENTLRSLEFDAGLLKDDGRNGENEALVGEEGDGTGGDEAREADDSRVRKGGLLLELGILTKYD